MQFSVLLLEIFLALGIVSALRCIYAKSEQVQVNMKLYLCHNTWKERELNPYVSSYPRWEPCCHSNRDRSVFGQRWYIRYNYCSVSSEGVDKRGEGGEFAEW